MGKVGVRYEFGEEQTATVSLVASNMRAAGVLMVVYGAGFVFMGFVAIINAPTAGEGWLGLVQAGLFLLLGSWTHRTGTAFGRIPTAKVYDPGLLTPTLDKLRRLYRLQKWLLTLGIVLFLTIGFGTFFLLYAVPKLQLRFQ
jgi:hypothetical protein